MIFLLRNPPAYRFCEMRFDLQWLSQHSFSDFCRQHHRMTLQTTTSSNQPPGWPSIYERFGLTVAFAVGLPVWCDAIAWCLAGKNAFADTLTHTSLHVWLFTAFCLLTIGVIYWLRRRQVVGASWLRRLVWIALPFTFLSVVVAPWRELPLTSYPPAKSKPIRIFVWNVYITNNDYSAAERTIKDVDADIVAIIECNPELGNVLSPLRDLYPHSLWEPRWKSQSMVVLSRIPNTTMSFNRQEGILMADLSFDSSSGKKSNLLVLHTLSPQWPEGRVAERNRQLMAAAQWAKDHASEPTLVMGDLNISPWSPAFGKMLRHGELTDTRNYVGYFATWPAALQDLGIPIDHALVNQHVRVTSRCVLPEGNGSDHRGIILEIE